MEFLAVWTHVRVLERIILLPTAAATYSLKTKVSWKEEMIALEIVVHTVWLDVRLVGLASWAEPDEQPYETNTGLEETKAKIAWYISQCHLVH